MLVPLSWATSNEEPLADARNCSEPGVYAHESNCQLYLECSSTGPANGSLQLLTKSCPEREAFSSELNRCTRDISSCSVPVKCLSKGVIADPNTNTCYYLCQPRFTGSGFHIYHVHCEKNTIFYSWLGICLADIEYLFENGLPDLAENTDLNAVMADIRRMKNEYKAKIKKEKEDKKSLKRVQKQTDHSAHSQESLRKESLTLEASRYKCETEGNFASQLGDNYYLSCIISNGKLIAVPHECSVGAKFNPATGSCVKV